MRKRIRKIFLLILLLIFITGLLLPQKFSIPVEGAASSDYNPDSFWYYPWGKSVTHKGVDIFAKEGTNVLSSTSGIVLYKGKLGRGGNVILVLGPKWRLHYYAHLLNAECGTMDYLNRGEIIGKVGTTGNAAGKAPHLHYTIVTMIPYFLRMDGDRQGWKKMFYLNPIDYMQ